MTTSFEQTPASSQISEQPKGFIRAVGRTRKAGYWLCGAGIAVVLSSFLPWTNIDGYDATHPEGGSVVMLLVIGGLLAYFGTRVFQGRISKPAAVALWVLTAVDVFLSLAIFSAASHLPAEGDGIVSVTPAVGFYLGIGGLLAGVVGTVLVQTVRHKQSHASRPTGSGH